MKATHIKADTFYPGTSDKDNVFIGYENGSLDILSYPKSNINYHIHFDQFNQQPYNNLNYYPLPIKDIKL